MSEYELVTLGGVTLNDGTNFDLLEFTPGIAEKKPIWITGAHSDGGLLVEEAHYDNAVMEMKLAVAKQATMDLALAKLGEIVQVLQECEKNERGQAGTWTPADSTKTQTYYGLMGEVVGLPIGTEGEGRAWLSKQPYVQIRIVRRPFLYGSEVTTVTDDFSTDTIANYTFDAGAAGNVAVSGGVLDAVNNLTTENRFFLTAGRSYTDSQQTLKHTLGTTLTNYKAGVLLKRIDSDDYLEAYVDDTGADSRLRLDKIVGGARTNLSSTTLTRMTTSTAYWLRARIEGNLVTLEHWTAAPTDTGSAASSATHTLAGTNATSFGLGVAGRAGLVWTPQQTASSLDDYAVAPNTFKSSAPLLTATVHDVEGDVPAEGRLVITDSAGQSRRHCEWGLESRHYSAGKPRILDQFGTDTIGSGAWAFIQGAGEVSVSGGQLVPSNTNTKRFYRNDATYTDVSVTHKLTFGAAASNYGGAAAAKILDGGNYLFLVNEGGNLVLYKKDVGVNTILLTGGAVTTSAATSYWIRLTVEGNVVTGEWFTADPATGATAARTLTHTLTGSDAVKFGAGVAGYAGIGYWTPAATDWRIDDFRIDPLSGNTDLLLDSENLVTSGLGGTQTTRTGAYTGGTVANHVVRGTLTTTPVAICGTGSLGHVGTFRVRARVYAAPTSDASADDFKVRLSWREGDGPLRSNSYASPVVVNGWSEVDLGIVHIPEATLGTQRWAGQIEAYSEDAGDILDVDFVDFLPAGEGYGKARAPDVIVTPTSFSARDEFDQTAGALTGKALPLGGTWAGAGDTDDFSVETTGKTAQRTAVSDAEPGRFAIAGTTNFTDLDVQIDFKFSAYSGASLSGGLLARYTDTSNYLVAYLLPAVTGGSGSTIRFGVTKTVAGTTTVLGSVNTGLPTQVDTFYSLRLVVYADGTWRLWGNERGGTAALVLSGSDSALATGGALATGNLGFFDKLTTAGAVTRNYDNFVAFVPAEPAVIFSGQSAEIRHDSAIREDSTGTYWGPVPSYRGAHFFLPPAGDEDRATRIAAKLRRNDIDVAADDQIADSLTVQVAITPRFLVAPR